MFFGTFSCAQCTYHFTNYQVWDFPVSTDFHVHDVRTIFGGLSVSLVYFRVHDVQTMLTDNSGAH